MSARLIAFASFFLLLRKEYLFKPILTQMSMHRNSEPASVQPLIGSRRSCFWMRGEEYDVIGYGLVARSRTALAQILPQSQCQYCSNIDFPNTPLGHGNDQRPTSVIDGGVSMNCLRTSRIGQHHPQQMDDWSSVTNIRQ